MFRRMTLGIAALALVLAGFLGLSATPTLAAPPGPSIVDVAIAANTEGPFQGEFDTLIAALLAADPAVINTLSGNGQFTVFAPNDAAFAELNLDENSVGDLDQAALTQILLYHVARGRRNSNAVLGSSRIRTLQRGFIFQSGGLLTDNQGRDVGFVFTDVQAANGTIHIINRVLLP